jgi:hypothetical protein
MVGFPVLQRRTAKFVSLYCWRVDVERIIDDLEQLQEMFEAPDTGPLSARDNLSTSRRHDEMLAHSPWFRCGRILASAAEPSRQQSN